MPRSICVPNLKLLGIPVPNLWKAGVQNLQIWLRTPNTPHLGNFVISDMSRSICVQNLMFLATPVQNLWKGVQNLQIWPLDFHYIQLGGILLSVRWDMSTSIRVPNFKSLRQLNIRHGVSNRQDRWLLITVKQFIWQWHRKTTGTVGTTSKVSADTDYRLTLSGIVLAVNDRYGTVSATVQWLT